MPFSSGAQMAFPGGRNDQIQEICVDDGVETEQHQQQTISPTPSESVFSVVTEPTTNDQIHEICVDDGVETEQHQQQTISPTPSESVFSVVTEPTTNGGIGPGNDSVADSLRNDQLSQQLQPTTIAQPTVKKKCLAVVEVEQKNKPTICLKYAFFVPETETVSVSGNKHCNPTVEHMMRTLLPNHLRLSMEQLTENFDLQLQHLDNEFEPARFIDIDPREWGAEWVKNRGEYKVVLHRKLDDDNNAGGISGGGKVVPEKVGDEHRRDGEDVTISEPQKANTKQESFDRFLVSGKANLGNLYNASTDNFVTSDDIKYIRKIFNLRNYTKQSGGGTTIGKQIVEIDDLNSSEERTKMLGPEQKLSVISRLALLDGVSPLGQFLSAAAKQKELSTTNSFGIIQMSLKMISSLNLDDSKVRKSVLKQKDRDDEATHFVGSACFGTLVAAILTFDEQTSLEEAKKLALLHIRGNAMSTSESDALKSLNKSVRISVFVDPTIGAGGTDLDFACGLNLFVDSFKKSSNINNGFGHPITFSLIPLSAIADKKSKHTFRPVPMIEANNIYVQIQSCVQSVEEFELLLKAAGQSQNEYAYTLTKDQLNNAIQMFGDLETKKVAIDALIKKCVIRLRRHPGTSFDATGTEEAEQLSIETLEDAVRQYKTDAGYMLELCDQKLLPKIELTERLKSKGVNYIGGRGTRRLADVFKGNDESDLASALHFVLLYNQLETTPPVVGESSIQNDPERLHNQCLGQLFEKAGRGTSCTYVDWDVLRSYDDFTSIKKELPDDIRALDGFPNNIGIRLVKMRGHKLLTADCVTEECDKFRTYIAWIENSERIEVGAVPPADQTTEACSLPCPRSECYGGKCQNNDFHWGCDACGQTLTFVKQDNVPVTHFYCACGATPVEEFSFRCLDVKTHGNEFEHFAPNALAVELKRMNDKGILNILLLGETGVGKSTLINAVVNYLKHASFKEAIQADKIEWVIPTKFSIVEYADHEFSVKRDVQLGEESAEEQLKTGKSRTKWPKAYIITWKGYKTRLIDSGGILDTGGIKEDDKNFHKTINYSSTFPELHAICFVLRSDCTIAGTAFKYCINELLKYLHKNAAKNIIFLGTKGRGSGYQMVKTLELLPEELAQVESNHKVKIPLHPNRIYCMDNEAFEHLCLIKKANVQYSKKEMDNFSESWRRADQEFQRMLKNVSALEPHRTRETVSLSEARRIIVDLAPALADISEAIQDNLVRIEAYEEAISRGEQEMTTAPVLKTVRRELLPYPRTVCTSDRCTEVKRTEEGDFKVYRRKCHKHCYLEGIPLELCDQEALKYCWAMDGQDKGKCRIDECGCDWSVHMHITFKQKLVPLELDEATRNKFADKSELLNTLTRDKLQIMHERTTIYSKAAPLCGFVNKWALMPSNDCMEPYIKLSIENAKRLANKSEGASDHELNTKKLKGLEESLRLYREQKKLVENAKSDNVNTPSEVTAEDVNKLFEELCELPMFGKSIRQTYEIQQQARLKLQEGYTEKNLVTGLVPKPSRNIDAAGKQAKEQHLNKLEQDGELKSTVKTGTLWNTACYRARHYAGRVPVIGRFVKSQAQPSSSSGTSNRAKKNNH
uniref:G domain-containing protein n=1 Tax=Globodera rostochiensis TaxID=31243 RepID=A0A914IE53_GLORO